MKLAKILKSICEEFIKLPSSLGFKRSELPQIPSEKMDDFLSYLKDVGCDYERYAAPANELTPSQNELDTDKADKIWSEGKAFDTPIIISADKYVLDGHHRWFAVKRNAPNEKMDTIMLGQNALPCIDLMHDFEHVEVNDLKDNPVSSQPETTL